MGAGSAGTKRLPPPRPSPPAPSPSDPSASPPLDPRELERWRIEAQSTVSRVREEVDSAQLANVRGFGWSWVAIAVSVGAIDLAGALQDYLGSVNTSYLLGQLWLPVIFAIVGLLPLLWPERLLELRRRNQKGLRGSPRGEPTDGSPVASAIADLESLQRELLSADSSRAFVVLGALLAGLGGLLLAIFTAWSVSRAVATRAPPIVPALDLLAAFAAAGVIALALRRIWASSSEIHHLAARLERFEQRIWELQTAFWVRF